MMRVKSKMKGGNGIEMAGLQAYMQTCEAFRRMIRVVARYVGGTESVRSTCVVLAAATNTTELSAVRL